MGQKIEEEKEFFLSPEVYQIILGASSNISFDPYKNDSFVFGLCFLDIAGGFNISKLYNKGSFDSELLEQYLDEFTKNFPENKVLA